MSVPLRRTLQSSPAVEAEGDVEALDALARRALDQVVQRRGDDRLLSLGRDIDEAQVCVARELGRGRVVDHAREWLAGIELAISVFQLSHRALQVEVAGREDAAGHRDQMGDEGHAYAPVPAQLPKLLGQLRQVAVTADRVGPHGLVDLAEMDSDARRTSGATDARLGIHDDVRTD